LSTIFVTAPGSCIIEDVAGAYFSLSLRETRARRRGLGFSRRGLSSGWAIRSITGVEHRPDEIRLTLLPPRGERVIAGSCSGVLRVSPHLGLHPVPPHGNSPSFLRIGRQRIMSTFKRLLSCFVALCRAARACGDGFADRSNKREIAPRMEMIWLNRTAPKKG
jgi:hypothetical protein